jgi:hypothetical protein
MLLVQTSWWQTITCSKHIVDNLRAINYKEKCASCWSFSRMYTSVTITRIVRISHHQPQFILQLVCEDRDWSSWVDLHFPLWEQQHPKWERAVRLVYPPFFCTLRCSSNPTNKNSKKSGLEIQILLLVTIQNYTYAYVHTILSPPQQWPTTSPPKTLPFPPESPLHKIDDLIRWKHVALLYTRLTVFITT